MKKCIDRNSIYFTKCKQLVMSYKLLTMTDTKHFTAVTAKEHTTGDTDACYL